MKKPTLYIFDLDGTLSDSSQRAHYVQSQPKNWDAWHLECGQDAPIESTIDLMKALMAMCYMRNRIHGTKDIVKIWTGRGSQTRAITVSWLAKYADIGFSECDRMLTMRAEGDHRDDFELKREWLNAVRGDYDQIVTFEDRQRVVDMWRAEGVQCYQVAPGAF